MEGAMSCIKDWPAADRPREKLLSTSPEALSDSELLSLILRTGHPGRGTSALDLARQLLNGFGSLRALTSATAAELCQIAGIGPAKAAEILALGELSRRFATTSFAPGACFTSSREVFAHFHERLRDRKKEVFFSLLLDSKNRMLREIQVSEGSLNASIVHPREVFQPIIRESAAAVLFVHNHPSGDPSPSPEDLELTARLNDAGLLMGVRVLDHIIIGSGHYVSLADRGMLG
jgi:DNA repair protein RadC